MVKSHIKDVRRNLKYFHEYYERVGSHTKAMYLDQLNHMKNSGLRQSRIDQEIEEIKTRYRDDVIRHIGMYVPFYVGKQWFGEGVFFWDFYRIVDVVWDIAELEEDDRCPTVKSITVYKFNNKTKEKVEEYFIENPETDENLLGIWEGGVAVDKEDNY